MDETSTDDVAVTANRGEAFLAHYGVKGMRWGVRNDDSGASNRQIRKVDQHRDTAARNARIASKTASKRDLIDQAVFGKGMSGFGGALSLSPKVASKLADHYNKKADKIESKMVDADWRKDVRSTETANKIFQAAAKDFEKSAKIINEDPIYAGKDLTAPANKNLARDYDTTMSNVFNHHMEQSSINMTLNAQTGRAYRYQFDRESGLMRGAEVKQTKHASEKLFPDYSVEMDEKGHAVGFDVAADHLAHYGVKGMRWGVRKSDGSSRSGSSEVKVTQKKAGTYAKASGGKKLPISEDAAAALEARQKAKKSTTDSLTNVELRKVVERMNLEQQYANLSYQSDRRSKGAKFVAGLSGNKRYTGEKRKFKDTHEELGGAIGAALDKRYGSK